jgi:hypothetical protein
VQVTGRIVANNLTVLRQLAVDGGPRYGWRRPTLQAVDSYAFCLPGHMSPRTSMR